MKKLVLAILFISLIVGLVVFFVNEETITESGELVDSAKSPTNQSDAKKSVASKQANSLEQKSEEPSGKSEESAETSGLSCYQRYTKKEKWKEVEEKFEEIYIDMTYLNEDGNAYTNMPIESLKSFADSGDKDAMIFYGIELMQTGTIGLSSLKRAEINRMRYMEQAKAERREHEPQLAKLELGANYIYKAALDGKIATIFEIGLYYRYLAYQMAEKEWARQDRISALAKSHAYHLLQTDILKNNSLLAELVGEDSLEYAIKRSFPNQDTFEEIESQIKAQGEKMFLGLKHRWATDRRLKGLSPYPSLFSGELREFTKKMASECYSN